MDLGVDDLTNFNIASGLRGSCIARFERLHEHIADSLPRTRTVEEIDLQEFGRGSAVHFV